MSHHISINDPAETTYWILHNPDNNRYLSGITQPGQTTEASDAWEFHMVTTTPQQWVDECILLNIPYEDILII